MSDDLLLALVERGDQISIEGGRLRVVPQSGKEVPAEWLKEYYWTLVEQVLRCTGRPGWRYDRFTRSSGGYNGGRYPGITLHYIDVLTDEEVYLIFNAKVTKAASSELRAGKSFLPPERGGFLKYWKRTVGVLPQGRRSKCCESMSSFKDIVVDLAPDYKGKARNKTAMALEISSSQIRDSLADYLRTNSEPNSNPARTNLTIHGIAEELAGTDLQRNPSTCADNYELSKQDSELTRQESIEEWIQDYGDEF